MPDALARGGSTDLIASATKAIAPWTTRPATTLTQALTQTVPIGPALLVHDAQKAAFFIGGTERLVIDTALFGRTPTLSVTVQAGTVRVTLCRSSRAYRRSPET